MAAALTLACTGSPPPPTTRPLVLPSPLRGESVTGTVGAALPFAGLTLTLGEIADPAPPGEAVVLPDPGTRYVRCSIRVANRTDRGLSFVPLVQAALVDTGGGVAKPAPGLYPTDLAGADVQPGTEVTGTISFVLAVGRIADRVVFTHEGVATTVRL